MYPHTHSHWLYYYLTYRNRKSYILRFYLKKWFGTLKGETLKDSLWNPRASDFRSDQAWTNPDLTEMVSIVLHCSRLLRPWMHSVGTVTVRHSKQWPKQVTGKTGTWIGKKNKQRGERLFSKRKQPLNPIFLFRLTQGLWWLSATCLSAVGR